MIRFATIGTNFVVEWFLKCAAQVEGLQYNGTYSRNIEKAEKFAKEHNGNLIFGNLEELAKSKDVDAVYIASPNSLHYEQARLMIKNKKHVMIEKTITSNLRELNELCRLAKENNVVIMEAMRSVYSPGFLAIKDAMKKIEPVRRVEFQYCQYSSRYDKYKNGIIENAFNPSFSNGALMDIGVYCVHPLVKLFGLPDEIKATATMLPDRIDGQGTITCAYDGMIADISYSKITNGRLPSQIQGEKGTILIEDIPNPRKIKIIYNDGYEENIENIPCKDLNLEYEAEEWAKLINKGEFTDKHIKYSVMCIKVMDEARRQQNIVFPADK